MFEVASGIAQETDKVAWLYGRYGRKLYGYAVSKWKVSEDDAWELVYKTLYKILKVKDRYTFEDENRFVGFLFNTFINYLKNHYRDSKKDPEMTALEEKHGKLLSGENENPPERASPLMECMQQVLEVLEDWQRIVLLMRAQDHSYDNISKYVNKPPSQLKVYHLRLKKIVTDKTNECMDKKNK